MQQLHEIRSRLARVEQSHLLRYYDELSEAHQRDLLAQIAAIDLERLPPLIDRYVRSPVAASVPAELEPVEPYSTRPGARAWDATSARATGERLLRGGKVAAFVVAGGQGSRLGYDGPKGCFRAGAVSGRSLFEMFARQLLGAKARYGRDVPWYIMTSPLNHRATVGFFEDHHYFGLERANIMFFQQGVMPSLEMGTGRILLSRKDEVATNPDGHGGSIAALRKSGALLDMHRRGIEHLSYFQVDNPLVRILDPIFLGLHADAPDSSGEMSSKTIAKTDPGEKVGVFARLTRDGRKVLDVIEYSDLPAHLASARNADGTLRFQAGSIAVHLISVAFLEKLANDPKFELPYHRADKKVAFIDERTGELVQPSVNNAVKLEKFVFDALPLCRSSIVYETCREEEFAPIKNATGNDSPESCTRLQTARAAAWLEGMGVRVPRHADGTPDCTLEIDPAHAAEPQDLRARADGLAIRAGAQMLL